MALFSRRRLLVSLHRSAAIVSQEKLKDWVARLNMISDDYVATEWELILLEAFSHLGSLRYEPEELGRVDLCFESVDGSVSFAADIIAVSDRQLHKENPAAFFAYELRRKLRKGRITCGTLFYEIREKDHRQGWGRGHERVLLLPHVSAFSKIIFNDNWLTFIAAIHANPASRHEFHAFQSGETDVRVSYMPCSDRLNFYGSHGSYTSANVLTDNSLFNSLQRKAKKLKKINHRGMRGIIVCDGGCELLTIPPGWESYSTREITAELFRQFKSIDFVLIIGVKSSPRLHLTLSSSHQYAPQLFLNPRLKDDFPCFRSVLVSMLKRLPPPQMSPGNVINEVKWDRPKLSPSSYTGGWRWSDNSTRMSSRELLAVLSGGLPQDQFLENHRLANGGHGFLTRFASGREITGIALEPRPDEDDDYLTIYFGSPDCCETAVCDAFTESEILVPSRELLYFLAGIINRGELMSYAHPSNGFEKGIAAGQTIQGARYRRDGNRGWIHLKFGDRDPAVSPFWVPGSGSR
jgi:hypothetical protein